MNDCEKFFYLLDKVESNKDALLELLEFLEVHIENENLYEIVIGWSEEKARGFAKQYDFDLDYLDCKIYDWDDDYIEEENENNPALAEQSYSVQI